MSLRIAIVHHHLRGGGVTRIIERTLEIMEELPVTLCVLCGEAPPGNEFDHYKVGVIPGLSYGDENPKRNVADLYSEMFAKAEELLGGEPNVWHIHNHTLGKTAEYTDLASKLARSGHSVLYHLHDFSEDNRPSNYKTLSAEHESMIPKERMYPTGNHIRYGLLNGRDFRILNESGIGNDHLELLSNPVVSEAPDTDISATFSGLDSSKRLTLYPVRGIPRKNIGEFVLWSGLAHEDEHFAMTLAPKNPKYKIGYDAWTEFVEEHDLPITFEAGKKWGVSYPEILDRADQIITTSVAEGFGLVFLEAWLISKPLAGRLIPSVTSDFESNGIQFPGMYKELMIPIEWAGADEVKEELKEGIRYNLKSYGKEVTEKVLKQWLDRIIINSQIDFGRLSSELQRKVILKIMNEPELKEQLRPLSTEEISVEVIEENKSTVQQKYNLEEYGSKLYDLYVELTESKGGDVEFIDPEIVLDKFLSPEYFSLLRS